MNFCENCNAAFESERCPVCGTKNIRQVQDDDFCFLIEDSTMHCDVLMGVLDTYEIPYSAMPFGSGVESRFGMPLGNYRIYVPFRCLENARSVLRGMETEKTEEWRAKLLDNAELFNIPQKTGKKICKKLKLPKETDLIAYCVDIVKSANMIKDEECIGMKWRYVFCYSDDIQITLNSKTFEILTVRKKNA